MTENIPTKISDNFSLTPQVRKIWDAITGNVRIKLLNNVWCGSCRETTDMGNVS